MKTIHTESIWAWVHNSRKPFGMGCYGFLPTLDRATRSCARALAWSM
jgi:hypothetical protein